MALYLSIILLTRHINLLPHMTETEFYSMILLQLYCTRMVGCICAQNRTSYSVICDTPGVFAVHGFLCETGVAPGIFRRGADLSDEGAKIWFSGYHKCQKSPKNRFHLPTGGWHAPTGAIAPTPPLAPPLMWNCYNRIVLRKVKKVQYTFFIRK